jgi:hypothetical protein
LLLRLGVRRRATIDRLPKKKKKKKKTTEKACKAV